MSDKNAATTSGGSGLLIGGIVIAIAIGAGSYMMVQQDASPTEEELSSVVPQNASVPDATPAAPPAPESAEVPAAPETPVIAALPPTEQASEDVTAAEAPAAAAPDAQAETEAPADETPQVAASETSVPADGAAGEGAESSSDAPQGQVEDVASVAPTIDEVRLDADGVAVIAGRAEPGATVEVVVDGDVIATAQADATGAFAAIGFLPPQDRARSLSLRAGRDGAMTASAGEVILAPVPAAPVVVAEAATAPQSTTEEAAQVLSTQEDQTGTADSAAAAAVEAPESTVETGAEESAPVVSATASAAGKTTAEPAPSAPEQVETAASDTSGTPPPPLAQAPADPAQTPETTVTVAETEAAPATTEPEAAPQVALLKSDEEGVTLLRTAPTPPASIQLDTIGYSDSGAVQLAGRASSEAVEIRVYLDNRAAATLPVADAGNWRGEVPDVAAGVYTLRVDEVNAGGAVTSRIETPFKREAPAVLAAVAAEAEGPATAVTVQTGDTLWAIARDRYGEGLLYVQVFEANRNAIRDPDLIYPGQIFELPPD